MKLVQLLSVLCLVSIVMCQVPGDNSVVDLSHWNAGVDFVKSKADGLRGVIHKATQGLSYVDSDYAPRKLQANDIHIKWGAYHFADGTDGVQQANHFLKTVGDDLNTLLALDIEENPSGLSVNLSIAEDFVTTIYAAKHRYPLVYGSAFLKDMVKGTSSILLKCPLWIAQWGSKPLIPENTWAYWTLWQYTDGQNGPTPHSVDGIGHCDRDTVNTDVHHDVEDMWRSAGYSEPVRTTPRPDLSTTSGYPRCTSTPSPRHY